MTQQHLNQDVTWFTHIVFVTDCENVGKTEISRHFVDEQQLLHSNAWLNKSYESSSANQIAAIRVSILLEFH